MKPNNHNKPRLYYRNGLRGFSLIEVMVVVAIVGVMLIVAIPSWNKYRQNTDLKTAARGVEGDFFNMRQRAVGESARYEIVFNEGDSSYQMINFETGDVVQARKVAEFAEGIAISDANFLGDDTMIFQARGTAENGHITLENSRGSTATITVNITGRTHVSFNMQ